MYIYVEFKRDFTELEVCEGVGECLWFLLRPLY